MLSLALTSNLQPEGSKTLNSRSITCLISPAPFLQIVYSSCVLRYLLLSYAISNMIRHQNKSYFTGLFISLGQFLYCG